MAQIDEVSWDLLLSRIKDNHCTPFIGAGISPNPLGSDIASRWAKEYHYPLSDSTDLARVAQFVAVARDAMVPKEKLLELFKQTVPPDFSDPLEPHGLLADLPLEGYITTNYDDFMTRALLSRNRDPARLVCRWNGSIEETGSRSKQDVAHPWVFHLHGSDSDPQSLVLTEDDYVDFLVTVQRDRKLLPHYVVRALSNTTLLFLGYSLTDWTFRVIFRGIVCALPNSLQRAHVAVQVPRTDDTAVEYLERYFGAMKVHVFWGTAREFTEQLRARWDAIRVG
jgi:hypothetical protein